VLPAVSEAARPPLVDLHHLTLMALFVSVLQILLARVVRWHLFSIVEELV
jgi:hypothetical protein